MSDKFYEFPEFQNQSSLNIDHLIHNNQILCKNLFSTKNLINQHKKWDVAKKFANEYELVSAFNNAGIADINPISRSFFKLIEIIHDMKLYPLLSDCACLCEGPGGFIQAIHTVASQANIPINSIHTITLISNDKKVPNWKNIDRFTNVVTHFGEDKTGNLYNFNNVRNFIDNVGKNTIALVTADGGFDFSNDFNSQETEFLRLLTIEIYIALNIQKVNGTFVCKVFDLFNINSIYLISMLRKYYKYVYFHKPKTSRPANSEKYIICSLFKNNIAPETLKTLKNIIQSGIYNYMCQILTTDEISDTYNYIISHARESHG